MIEERGIPTTVIGLVRPHMEKVQPPRGMWTPFQLGRPLGEPGDAWFQRRVVLQALKLLERTDGPVILEDFPYDAPNWSDRPGWYVPVALPTVKTPTGAADWAQALRAEMLALAPLFVKARERFGRTTVGVCGQQPEAWPEFLTAFLDGKLPAGPGPLSAPALALRFMIDDLKAYYTEAAQAVGDPPASRQLDHWFWRQTLAGALVRQLRTIGMASDNNGLKTVAGRFFVPAPWLAAG